MIIDEIYGGLGAIAIICFCLIGFAIWQESSKAKLAKEGFTSILPDQFASFQGMEYSHWYIGHFVSRFKDLFRRSEGTRGTWSIYDSHQALLATIGYSNSVVSTIRAGNRWISTKFDPMYPATLKKLYFFEFPKNVPVLTIEPFNKIQILNIDHSFTVSGKEYRLISRPSIAQYSCNYYCEGVLAGTIARVSIKQITIAVAQKEIDPLALGMVFDLFSRYAS